MGRGGRSGPAPPSWRVHRVLMAIRWRNSSKFLEDGVMQNTAYRFYRQISEHTAAKFMPGTQAPPRCSRDAAEIAAHLLSAAAAFSEAVPTALNTSTPHVLLRHPLLGRRVLGGRAVQKQPGGGEMQPRCSRDARDGCPRCARDAPETARDRRRKEDPSCHPFSDDPCGRTVFVLSERTCPARSRSRSRRDRGEITIAARSRRVCGECPTPSAETDHSAASSARLTTCPSCTTACASSSSRTKATSTTTS